MDKLKKGTNERPLNNHKEAKHPKHEDKTMHKAGHEGHEKLEKGAKKKMGDGCGTC